jgi:hypothetical protein
MPWEDIKQARQDMMATAAQIEYAEALLEELYGEINLPIYSMTKHEISKLITELKTQRGDIDDAKPDRFKAKIEELFRQRFNVLAGSRPYHPELCVIRNDALQAYDIRISNRANNWHATNSIPDVALIYGHEEATKALMDALIRKYITFLQGGVSND